MKKYLKVLLYVGAFILLTACTTQQPTEDTESSKRSDAYEWWGDRTRNFGQSDYTISDGEIVEELEKKYELKVIPLFYETRSLIEEELVKSSELKLKEELNILANESSFKLTSMMFVTNDENKTIASARTTAEYEYYKVRRKVKLASQATEIRTATDDEKYQGKDFEAFVETLIELLDISDSGKTLEAFEKKTSEGKESLAGAAIDLYDSRTTGQKERTTGKYLSIQYDGKGIPQNVFFGIEDYRS